MKISVIIPIYNTEEYLKRCIDSILAQSFSDFELILVDDGSTDNSGIICDEYAEKDNRLVVIHQDNQGQAVARNTALDYIFKKSNCDWITFVDSDDYVDENYLFDMITNIDYSKVDIVMSGFVLEDESKNQTQTHQRNQCFINISDKKERVRFIIKSIVNNLNSRSCWSNLFKREIVENNSLHFCTKCDDFAEDTGFLITYLFFCNNILMIDKCNYHYVRHDETTLTSIQNDYGKKLNSLNELSIYVAERYFAIFCGKELKKMFAELYFHLLKWDYNDYIIYGEHYDNLLNYIGEIENIEWHDYWIKKYSRHFKELFLLYGKSGAIKRIINLRYIVKRNTKLYGIESAIYYKALNNIRKIRG